MHHPTRKSDRHELQVEGDRRLIDQALTGLNESDRKKVLEFVSLTGVEPDDPMFPHTIQVARSLVTLAPLPACFEQFQDDLKGFKATAYEMRLTADRVTNLLRKRTFQSPENGLSLDRVLGYCFCAFLSGVLVTAFFPLLISLTKHSLPSVSNHTAL